MLGARLGAGRPLRGMNRHCHLSPALYVQVMRKSVKVTFGAFAFGLIGCGSDAKKLEQLHAEAAVSAAQVDTTRATAVRASIIEHAALDSAAAGLLSQPSKPHLDSLHALVALAEQRFHDANVRNELAQRELTKFMNGR
jgi:hypothetical protein